MPKGWKRVAESADNEAFRTPEIGEALAAALKQDCRAEVSTQFLHDFCAICLKQEGCLFKDQSGADLDNFRESALDLRFSVLEQSVLEHAIQLSGKGESGVVLGVKALADALAVRAAAGARQVEEHYCRESTVPRARRVRERIEQAIGHVPVQSLARQILKLDPRPAGRHSVKRRGLDDGVEL